MRKIINPGALFSIIIMIVLLCFITAFFGRGRNTPTREYTLDTYTDTIDNCVIMTNVVNNGYNISVTSTFVKELYNE